MTDADVLGRVQSELDTRSFRHVTGLLQPSWLRRGALIFPGIVGGIVFLSGQNPPMAIIATITVFALLRVVRHLMTEQEVRDFQTSRAGAIERYTLSSRGFKDADRLIPWAEVRQAAEINNPKAGFSLLAVRAGGKWCIWPSHGFLEGTFREARELLVAATGGPLRTMRL